MPEIWTISLTTTGIGACALSTEGPRRSFSASWPVSRAYGVRAIEPEAIRRMLAHALADLKANTESLPLAIGLCSPDGETAAFADENREFQTPFLADPQIVVPRRDVPDKYEIAPALVQAYRTSILRGIQIQAPTLGISKPLGLFSLGAAAALWLTENPASSCMPLGVPDHFPIFDDETREMFFSALGIQPQLTMKRARCGHLVGKISPDILDFLRAPDMPELAELASIPVFDMGSSNAGRAYASAADPLSWSVEIGTDLRANWTSGITALAAYELSIQDNPGVSSAPEPQEMTSNDWTRAYHEVMPLTVEPGPNAELACYGLAFRSIRSSLFANAFTHLLTPGSEVIDFKELQKSPLGSHGLHTVFEADRCQIIGLCSAHNDHDLVRSAFEGMVYALKERRERLAQGANGPIRLVLEAPWPQECAQWAADILNTDVYIIAESAASLSAFGICLALMRMLELPLAQRPAMQATIVEPGQRSAYYARHYQLHCMLSANTQ